MARPEPKTDSWTARENKHGKHGIFLIVGGCVHVTSTDQTPYLKEAVPPGINPRILILNLSIKAYGPGIDVLVRKPASFRTKVRADQYSSVDIHWDGNSIATAKVLDDGEHHQHLTKLVQAANAAHPHRKAKAAAKKKTTKKPTKAKPKAAARKKTAAKTKAAKPKSKKAPAPKRKSTGPKRKSAASSKAKKSARKKGR